MFYSLAYIFRRDDLTSDEFLRHYESRHTQLARAVLPRFSHYIRNHVTACAGTMDCPAVVSEFGYRSIDDFASAYAILKDGRGDVLLDDELAFMDKPRNRGFRAQRWQWGDAAATEKYILWLDSSVAPENHTQVWLDQIRSIDTGVAGAVFYHAAMVDSSAPMPCWLVWSNSRATPDLLLKKYHDRALSLVSCASVYEVVGYPGFDD